jgi:hypothetical protein
MVVGPYPYKEIPIVELVFELIKDKLAMNELIYRVNAHLVQCSEKVSDLDVLRHLIRYYDELGIKVANRIVLEWVLTSLANERKAEEFDQTI